MSVKIKMTISTFQVAKNHQQMEGFKNNLKMFSVSLERNYQIMTISASNHSAIELEINIMSTVMSTSFAILKICGHDRHAACFGVMKWHQCMQRADHDHRFSITDGTRKNGLVQDHGNSSANTLPLKLLFCTKQLIQSKRLYPFCTGNVAIMCSTSQVSCPARPSDAVPMCSQSVGGSGGYNVNSFTVSLHSLNDICLPSGLMNRTVRSLCKMEIPTGHVSPQCFTTEAILNYI